MNYKTFFLCLKFLTMVVICQGQINQPDAKKNELYNLYSKSHLSKLRNTSFIEYR